MILCGVVKEQSKWELPKFYECLGIINCLAGPGQIVLGVIQPDMVNRYASFDQSWLNNCNGFIIYLSRHERSKMLA